MEDWPLQEEYYDLLSLAHRTHARVIASVRPFYQIWHMALDRSGELASITMNLRIIGDLLSIAFLKK